jgi:hypothetical protein
MYALKNYATDCALTANGCVMQFRSQAGLKAFFIAGLFLISSWQEQTIFIKPVNEIL